MRFVSEEIKREIDKEYYYSLNPTNVLGQRMDAYWWAIDKEKGDFLYMRCAANPAWNINSSFGLFFEREQILLEVLGESEGRLSRNDIIQTWRVKKIQVPQMLINKGYTFKQIKELVKDAFDGLGNIGYERSKIKEVRVYFDVDIEIM